MKKSLDWTIMEEFVGRLTDLWENENWQKVNHHDKTNGLSQKAVNSYRREHPGSKLQTAVTTKPSKLKKGSKAAKRRKSFCARMSGNKGPMKKPNGKPTPKALALRRWNCESIEEMRELIILGENYIANLRVAEATGDKPFDTMMNKIKKGTGKQATADRKEQKQRNQEQTRQAIDSMFGGGNPADKLSIRKKGVAEGGGAQQAAIAIAKKESGKYTKLGKRKK